MKQMIDIWAVTNQNSDKGFDFKLIPKNKAYWMTDGDVNMGEVEVHFDPPADLDHQTLALKAIETLREKQADARAECEMRIKDLDEKIEKLLMITHQPEEEFIEAGDNVVNFEQPAAPVTVDDVAKAEKCEHGVSIHRQCLGCEVPF